MAGPADFSRKNQMSTNPPVSRHDLSSFRVCRDGHADAYGDRRKCVRTRPAGVIGNGTVARGIDWSERGANST
jgi:hypothetical protein